jgi:hypothetical protein
VNLYRLQNAANPEGLIVDQFDLLLLR